MTTIRCDACRKDVRDAHKDVNYSAILGRDMCNECYEKLVTNVRRQMEKHRPFRFAEYQDVLAKTVVRMTSGS